MTRTTVLSSSQRNAGTYTSTGKEAVDERATYEVLMTRAQQEDTTAEMTIDVHISTDGGMTWRPQHRYYWAGGISLNKLGQPEPRPCTVGIGVDSKTLVRVAIVSNKRLTFSVDVTA